MKILSLAILSISILLYPGFSNAEICGPVVISVKIEPGVGQNSGEIFHDLLESALRKGDYKFAANQYHMISLRRQWIENTAVEQAPQMCKNNIWSAFSRLLAKNGPELCSKQSTYNTRCVKAAGPVQYDPPPSSIKCSDPSKPEVEIKMTEEILLGQPFPVELVNATSISTPSADTITMIYDCIAEGSNDRRGSTARR